MSTATVPQDLPGGLTRLSISSSTLDIPSSQEQTPLSPNSSRSSTFARLKRGMSSSGVKRSKSTKSLGRTRATSFYHDMMATAGERPPLPTSKSELTLAPSIISSGNSMQDDNPTSSSRPPMPRASRMFLRKKQSKSSLIARTLNWMEDTRTPCEDDGANSPKPQISSPFNFQHLSHSVANGALQERAPASHSHLKYSRDLQDIRTYDMSAPTSAVEPGADWHLRAVKSMDNIKRISVMSFSQPMPPQIVAPQRHVASKSPSHGFRARPADGESPTLPEFGITEHCATIDSQLMSPSKLEARHAGLENANFDPDSIAQAVTTPDETAFLLDGEHPGLLEDVPEEDDSACECCATSNCRDESGCSTNQRLNRSCSDPVLPESAAQLEEIPARMSRQISGRAASGVYLDLDWDEDIDYCYDQLEAEGHCGDSDPAAQDIDESIADSEGLHMQQRRKSERTGNGALPLHVRRISSQLKEQGVSLQFAPMDADSCANIIVSPTLAESAELEHSNGSWPMFIPDLTESRRTFYSSRSSGSQLSKYPSGTSSYDVSSKRDSGLATAESSSTLSIPDLVPSSKRKSCSTKSSSIYSQQYLENIDNMVLPPQPVIPISHPASSSTVGYSQPEDQPLLEAPHTAQRTRSFSESASKVLSNAAEIRPQTTYHNRSISHAVGSIPRSPKCIFQPLDRIGASAARI